MDCGHHQSASETLGAEKSGGNEAAPYGKQAGALEARPVAAAAAATAADRVKENRVGRMIGV